MKKIVWGLAIIIIASIVVIACRKSDSPAKENLSSKFDVAASKEWWYGSFRKSTDYTTVDYSSVFAPFSKDGAIAGKKYPSWKDGIDYKIGGLQIVELPLVYNNQVSTFPGSERFDEAEKVRIASASLRKLLLIKKPGNSVVVRTITLIPSPEYAKQKNYDISSNTLQKPDPQFSGWLVVKDWKETIINFWQIENDRRVKKMTIEQKLTNAEPSGQNGGGMMLDQEVCNYEYVEKTGRLCVGETTKGDQPVDPDDCTDWYYYTYTAFEWVCHDVPDEEPEEGCSMGMTQEQCACMQYGIGCGDPDPDPDPEPDQCNMSQEDARALLDAVTSEVVYEETPGGGSETAPDANGTIKKPVVLNRHSVNYNWGLGYSSKYTLFFSGVLFKTNANASWKWNSIKYDEVKKTSGGAPPCFTANVTATVSGPVISNDKYFAAFEADVTSSLEFACLGGKQVDSDTDKIIGSYSSISAGQ